MWVKFKAILTREWELKIGTPPPPRNSAPLSLNWLGMIVYYRVRFELLGNCDQHSSWRIQICTHEKEMILLKGMIVWEPMVTEALLDSPRLFLLHQRQLLPPYRFSVEMTKDIPSHSVSNSAVLPITIDVSLNPGELSSSNSHVGFEKW